MNCNKETDSIFDDVLLFAKYYGSEKSRFFVVVGRQRLLAAGSSDLGGLLGQEDGLDVWQDTSLRDGDAGQEFVQLFVVSDGQLEMTRDDSRLLVVSGSVAGQLEHFSGQVFHDCCQIDWCSGSDTFGVVALAQQTVDTSDREL
jgi:hypothetical protein